MAGTELVRAVGLLLGAAMVVWGAAIWLGLGRGWVMAGPGDPNRLMALPWLTFLSLTAIAWAAARELGIVHGSPPAVVAEVILGGVFLIGILVGFTGRPRWALPPWYRRELAWRERAREANNGAPP